MLTGFQVTASASAVLFGLVLVSITFGYNAALNRFENIGDYRHFIDWFWMAGMANCIYFSYCFIISVHSSRSRYSYSNLVALTLVAWAILLGLHLLETRRLYRISNHDWPWFKRIFVGETVVIALLFGAFTLLTFWALFFTHSVNGRYTMLFTAVRYTLVFAAIRAVFLVRYTFAVLVELSACEQRNAAAGPPAPGDE